MVERLAVATAIIGHCEGCVLSPRLGIDNLWSIGFGNRFTVDGSAVNADTQPLQPYQARALLSDTLLGGTEPNLERNVRTALTEIQWGALISLAYNIGNTALARSTMMAEINLDELTAAAARFGDFVHVEGITGAVHGLVLRRALERGVWLGELDPLALTPVAVPSLQHPAFASRRPTTLTADDLNARQLALMRPTPIAI